MLTIVPSLLVMRNKTIVRSSGPTALAIPLSLSIGTIRRIYSWCASVDTQASLIVGTNNPNMWCDCIVVTVEKHGRRTRWPTKYTTWQRTAWAVRRMVCSWQVGRLCRADTLSRGLITVCISLIQRIIPSRTLPLSSFLTTSVQRGNYSVDRCSCQVRALTSLR